MESVKMMDGGGRRRDVFEDVQKICTPRLGGRGSGVVLLWVPGVFRARPICVCVLSSEIVCAIGDMSEEEANFKSKKAQ